LGFDSHLASQSSVFTPLIACLIILFSGGSESYATSASLAPVTPSKATRDALLF